jgi:hypothetical protein
MDYVRLYTVLLTHPKQERTSPRAWKALTLALMYAGQHETRGRIPPEARRALGMTPAVARELVEIGWMHVNGNGWVLHDWEEHQASLDELSEIRRKAREKKRAQRRQMKMEGGQ